MANANYQLGRRHDGDYNGNWQHWNWQHFHIGNIQQNPPHQEIGVHAVMRKKWYNTLIFQPRKENEETVEP